MEKSTLFTFNEETVTEDAVTVDPKIVENITLLAFNEETVTVDPRSKEKF